MQLSGFFILLTDDFFKCLYLGLCQSDSINGLIQLTVIQLSGEHYMPKIDITKTSVLGLN